MGAEVLLSGILGLLYFDPRWFCNAIVLITLLSYRRPPKKEWISFALAVIATSTIIGPSFCNPGGGALGGGGGLAIGGYLWIASLLILAFSPLFYVQRMTDGGSTGGR